MLLHTTTKAYEAPVVITAELSIAIEMHSISECGRTQYAYHHCVTMHVNTVPLALKLDRL